VADERAEEVQQHMGNHRFGHPEIMPDLAPAGTEESPSCKSG
jgi:hypothetical protein